MKKIKMIYKGGFPFTEVPKYGKFYKKEKDGPTSGMFDIGIAHALNRTSEWVPDNPADLKPPVVEKKPKQAVTNAK